MGLNSQPANLNELHSTAYEFQIQGKDTFSFFVTAANLPGLQLGSVLQPTYVGSVPHPGDHQYEELQVEFIVDEAMASWLEIHDWIKIASNLGEQESYDPENIRKDAILVLKSNSLSATLKVQFQGLFPISLSGLTFDSRNSSSDVVTATATFAYLKYELEIV